MRMAVDCGTDSGNISGLGQGGCYEGDRFGFEPGPDFTLKKFQEYADFFKAQYFSRNMNDAKDMGSNSSTLQEPCEPSVDKIEGEYWRIVEKATEEIEVRLQVEKSSGANLFSSLLTFSLVQLLLLFMKRAAILIVMWVFCCRFCMGLI